MTATTDTIRTALADRYRIERELGAGGMATVYLAQDEKHDRKVAVKVLRPELAAVIGGDRFLAEIKTTANLQHPHILPLFDSGEVEGTVFYVMPYIEGESLRDRLTREKQLPVGDAIRIAGQVAQALDYAHRHGVIHRDIKPENIMLHDGSALVADFGIALAASKAGDTRMTETGMSLGTPHYMSPEQAMGERDLDARTDVYALGVTLYEMLGGEPPFMGPTAQAIVARVLSEQPRPLSGLRPTVPPHVDLAVRTALQKLPADRYASATAFGEALLHAAPGTAEPILAARPATAVWLPWAVAAVAVLAAVAAFMTRESASPAPPSRLALLAAGLGGSGGSGLQKQVALTPDGGTVVYTVIDATGANRLARRALDATDGAVIPITSALAPTIGNPVVSPDGRTLLVSNLEGRLFTLPVDGGGLVPLRSGGRFSAFSTFGPDGDIWLTPSGTSSEVIHLSADDSVLGTVGPFPGGIRLHQVLGDGRRGLAIMRGVGSATGPATLVDLETGDLTELIPTGVVEVRYAAGYLLAVDAAGTMQAFPFDLGRGQISGGSVTIATGVSLTGTGIAQFAVAQNGTVAYIPEEPRSLAFVERSGLARPALSERRNFHAPTFSPDGRRLAMDFNSADGRDVWTLSLGDGTLTRATFDRDGHDPTWAPDGRAITYVSTKSGVLGLYRTRPGTAAPAESLHASPMLGWTGQWLRDGSALVTVGNSMIDGSESDVGILREAGRGAFEPVVASPFNETYPAVSPDGRWLAFVSDQSGQSEVYVRTLDGDGDVVQVSQIGGTEPVWSRAGSELFYRGLTPAGHTVLIAARIAPGRGFEVTGRSELFSLSDYIGTSPHANYDVSPDGHYFAMVQRSPSTRVMIIQNLPALVERLRGVGSSAP